MAREVGSKSKDYARPAFRQCSYCGHCFYYILQKCELSLSRSQILFQSYPYCPQSWSLPCPQKKCYCQFIYNVAFSLQQCILTEHSNLSRLSVKDAYRLIRSIEAGAHLRTWGCSGDKRWSRGCVPLSTSPSVHHLWDSASVSLLSTSYPIEDTFISCNNWKISNMLFLMKLTTLTTYFCSVIQSLLSLMVRVFLK